MSDWDGSSDGGKPGATAAAVPVKKSKWKGEGEDEEVASDWEESSDSDAARQASTAGLPPPKKKGTLKQKLAEKEAEQKRRLENGEFDEEYMDMREKFMDEKEMRRIMREKELEADMNNASDLFGAASIRPTSSVPTKGASKPAAAAAAAPKLPAHLAPFLALPPKLTTKADFDALSRLIYTNLIQPHATSGQYAAFVETHTKVLCSTLKEGETRKVANVVTGLVAEKVAATRAAAKKKTGGSAVVSGKGMLAGDGGGKGKYDMTVYDEALDDFGGDPDDFM